MSNEATACGARGVNRRPPAGRFLGIWLVLSLSVAACTLCAAGTAWATGALAPQPAVPTTAPATTTTTTEAAPRVTTTATAAALPAATTTTIGAPAVRAKSAVLIDAATGSVLYARQPSAQAAMGSIAKIMTAMLVLDTLPLGKVVTVSARAAAVGEQSCGLRAGDRLTVEQLLFGALVHSGNDAAFALAEAAGGSMEHFVGMMNQKAWELGLSNTHYVNPDGLDAKGEYSSAADLAVLARVAMQRPEFSRIVGTVSYSLAVPSAAKPLIFRNVNRLLGKVDWVTGVKTGSTSDAGFCLVASGSREGTSVISVVLGEPNWTATWADSQALLEYGFAIERPVAVWAVVRASWDGLMGWGLAQGSRSVHLS